jgi:transcriptional regulator with XRE-family HTH domain
MNKSKKDERAELAPARRRGHLSPGQSLKILRELQEMTQNELAAASSIDQAVISAMEHGRVTIGEVRARKLARALRVHPAVILFADWDDDLIKASPDIEKPGTRITARTRAHRVA